MSKRPLGVAIVGCGTIGRIHLAAALEFDQLAIVALVDSSLENASGLADGVELKGRPRPTVYATLADALKDSAVDLVVIATPTGFHIDQSLEVLNAGKHLILEKPLDVDLKRVPEVELASSLAAKNGVVSTVISQHRFDPASQVVFDAIRANKLGRICSAIASLSWWRSQEYYDSGDWRGTWTLDGGGAVMNQGVHNVDLLVWFLGRPVQIFSHIALLAHQDVEVEDTAIATITFESGALAVLHATTAAYPGLTARIQIMGSSGSAIIDGDKLSYFHVARDGEDVGKLGLGGGGNQASEILGTVASADDVVVDPTSDSAGHVRQYADVLRAIETGTNPGVQVSDAAVALATVRAIYVASALGAPVLFDDVLNGKYESMSGRVPIS